MIVSAVKEGNASVHRIGRTELQAFGEAVFRAAGSDADEARIVAAHLVEANLAGHDSHGVMRIYKYINWVKRGQVVPNRHAEIVSDRDARCSLTAISVTARLSASKRWRSRRQQRRQWFCRDVDPQRRPSRPDRCLGGVARRTRLASFHFVNTSGFGILVAPHGGSDRRLSANPLAAGAPVKDGRPLVLDIATSVIAEGKIQVMKNKGEKLAPGMVLDGAGRPTTDPEAFYASPPGAIFPFGGHKGSGLSFISEVLAGSLSGGIASNPNTPTAGRLVNNMLIPRLRSRCLRRWRFLRRRREAPDGMDARLAADRAGRLGAAPGRDRGPHADRTRGNGIPIDRETWAKIAAAAASVGVAAPCG